MLMKVMYVPMVMYLTDSCSKMRMSIFHPRKLQDLISLAWLPEGININFTTQESINADRIVDYLDRFSFEVKKKTVVVLDNASVHRKRKVKEMRKIWENRRLFLVYLPPYSPELKPVETLWCILKGKWIRPADYNTKDSNFYCTNRALASVGKNLFVNYSYI